MLPKFFQNGNISQKRPQQIINMSKKTLSTPHKKTATPPNKKTTQKKEPAKDSSPQKYIPYITSPKHTNFIP
jgi:hypothetical protein